MLFCPHCGTKIVQGDKFCRECGSNLSIIGDENEGAGSDEQNRGSSAGNILFSEPSKNDAFTGNGMDGFGMNGFGMMDVFPSAESEYYARISEERAHLEAEEAALERVARASGYYKVIYKNDGAVGFTSKKKFYAPGDNVEVIYRGIMSDATYEFNVDVKDFDLKFDERYNCVIAFVMPDHDVEVTCK